MAEPRQGVPGPEKPVLDHVLRVGVADHGAGEADEPIPFGLDQQAEGGAVPGGGAADGGAEVGQVRPAGQGRCGGVHAR